ncbi:hypothetical protein TNIN_37131 [Trichonephila inaurata madagascariensis]|uniref:Transposase n=1 Tax=Trichonephila inaurata madagascariensis TaxID=2747483 RepID=A0A8X7CG43_9ARAC|nr:hypothetical protein TNIN_37131 [Trichonephila inaurata madagascariensis]
MLAKIKGRKRHIIVDTVGLVIAAEVHSASIQDRDSALNLLPKLNKFPNFTHPTPTKFTFTVVASFIDVQNLTSPYFLLDLLILFLLF